MKSCLCASALVVLLIGVAVMLAPRTATADQRPRCETVSGELEEDPGTAGQCPADHPSCFVGAIRGPNFRATTRFFAESSAAPSSTSPDWFSYSGVTTYTMPRGSIITRETGLGSKVPIPEATGRASLSMEVITGGTGDFEGVTGYFFVNGFVADPARHVTSLVMGKICRP